SNHSCERNFFLVAGPDMTISQTLVDRSLGHAPGSGKDFATPGPLASAVSPGSPGNLRVPPGLEGWTCGRRCATPGHRVRRSSMALVIEGEQRIQAPQAAVWAALNDPEILRQCI